MAVVFAIKAADEFDEAATVVRNIEEPGPLADFLASNLDVDAAAKQAYLEENRVDERLRRVGEELVDRLAAVKNTSRAYVVGGQPRQVSVRFAGEGAQLGHFGDHHGDDFQAVIFDQWKILRLEHLDSCVSGVGDGQGDGLGDEPRASRIARARRRCRKR